jgi:hypothetical protein
MLRAFCDSDSLHRVGAGAGGYERRTALTCHWTSTALEASGWTPFKKKRRKKGSGAFSVFEHVAGGWLCVGLGLGLSFLVIGSLFSRSV